jgi:hypothetical protein
VTAEREDAGGARSSLPTLRDLPIPLVGRRSTSLRLGSPVLPVEIIPDVDARLRGQPRYEKGDAPTLLEAYLRLWRIKPAQLARECGYSRQHLLRIRMGRMEPSRPAIAAITRACRRLGDRDLRADDLFDLGGPREGIEPSEYDRPVIAVDALRPAGGNP